VVHSVSSTAVSARLFSHRLLLLASSRVGRAVLVAGLIGLMALSNRGVVVVLVGVLRLVEAPFGSVADKVATSAMAASASEQGAALLGGMHVLAWLMEGTALTSRLLAGVLQACLRTYGCLGVALILIVFASVSVVGSSGGSFTIAQSRGLQGRVT